MSPAMYANLPDRLWDVSEIVKLIEVAETDNETAAT